MGNSSFPNSIETYIKFMHFLLQKVNFVIRSKRKNSILTHFRCCSSHWWMGRKTKVIISREKNQFVVKFCVQSRGILQCKLWSAKFVTYIHKQETSWSKKRMHLDFVLKKSFNLKFTSNVHNSFICGMKCTFMVHKESHAKITGYTYIANRGRNLIKKFYSQIYMMNEICIQERRNS